MPYTLKNLPAAAKALPKAAQEIWLAAYNAAYEEYEKDEEKAAATAWAAVGKKYEKGEDDVWRAKEDLSLERIRDMLWAEVSKKFPRQGDEPGAYVNEVYPAYLVYERAGKYYRLAWSMLEGEVKLGENSVEVEREWVEARQQEAEADEQMEVLIRLGAAQDKEGKAFEVTICEPGHTKNGWYIPEDALREAEGLFEGVDVNLFELPSREATHLPGELFEIKQLLVKNKVGWIDKAKFVAGRGLTGILHFVDSARWLGKNLLAALKEGKPVYGLSYDAIVRAKKDTVDGKSVFKVGKFLSADSVDIVTRPAAGGKFNRAVAGMPAHNKEEIMKQKLWNLVFAKRPDLLKDKTLEKISDEEMETLAKAAMEPPADDKKGKGGDKGQDNLVTKEDLEKLRSEMALKDRLAASDLPEVSKERIRAAFADKTAAAAEIDRAIADEKEYLAKINPQAQTVIIPGSGITGGLGSFDRACMAVDRMFGLEKETIEQMAKLERLDHKPFFGDMRSVQDYADYDKVPAFHSLREMYLFFTGDAEVTGRFNRKALAPELRSTQDINSATFAFVLGNTMGRRLVALYREMKYQEELLISVRKAVKDFRTQEAVLVGGFPDISDVDPEAADYDEIAGVTDEESTYALLQKGNILTITRKMIINDDITIVQRLVSGLARAARRTHAKYVWNFFTANATCSDGTAWFTGGHGNLTAGPLTHATALTAYKALAKMTEKDSGERIGLLDSPDVKPNLVGPIDLMETIEQIANEDYYFATNDLTDKIPNPLKGKVTPKIITLFTDTTDWGLILPPDITDIVEMGYLNGREEPELFVADTPNSEQVFVADKIRHKIRHEYAGAVVDFRSGYKGIV